LTTDLSRALPGSFVVARGTAFTYKGRRVAAAQVGRELNVRYVITGSLLVEGERVRVNAQLADAASDAELWSERFDKERGEVLDVQNDIVARVSRAAGLEVIDFESHRSERARNPTAMDFVMRGQAIANRPASRETMIAARALFERALEHDGDSVDALAGTATTYVFEVLNTYYDAGRDERLRKAEALLDRALALAPRHLVALKTRAAWLRAKGEFADAVEASKAVIAQNPGEPWAYKEVGLSELYRGNLREAQVWFEKADEIGPRDPSRWIWLGAMGRVEFFLGHEANAIRLLKTSAAANPRDPRAYALLAAVHALAGRSEAAAVALASCLALDPAMTTTRFAAGWSVPLSATSPEYALHHELIQRGLLTAGMREK
jgi:TolB-like protein/cytochrome c-type biogenesis protein CcmH/NrfG